MSGKARWSAVAAVVAVASLVFWRMPLVPVIVWCALLIWVWRDRTRFDPLVFLLASLLGMAALGAWLAPYDPAFQFVGASEHLLGLDRTGRDLFSRLLSGNQNSAAIAGAGSLGACFVGLGVGLCMALGPRWFTWGIDRLIQAYLTIPILIYYLLGLALFAPGAATLVGLLAMTLGPDLARIVQVRITELREAPFVQTARMAGLNGAAIIVREIMPNVVRLLAVNFLMCFGTAIIIESVLGYLGLGLSVGTPSLGHLIEYGVRNMDRQPQVLPVALTMLLAWIIGLRLLSQRLGKPEMIATMP